MATTAVAGLVLANASAARAAHPPDPFADQYVVPADRDVGTAAGQLRAIGSPAVAIGRAGAELGAQGTLEVMTLAYLGLRSTLAWTALRPSGEPMVLAGTIGPSLHLLPYRTLDASLFFEGGFAGVDLTGTPTAMPIVAPGLALDAWIASWAFLRAEGRLDWGIYGANDAARGYLRFVASAGLGLAI
jgi:hypothetical protein